MIYFAGFFTTCRDNQIWTSKQMIRTAIREDSSIFGGWNFLRFRGCLSYGYQPLINQATSLSSTTKARARIKKSSKLMEKPSIFPLNFSRSSDHGIIFHRSLFWLLMMEVVVKGLTPLKMMIDGWTIILNGEWYLHFTQFVKKKSGVKFLL